MLKNLDPILTPDVLHALCSMGHGDEIAIVDSHYPADTAGKASTVGKALRMDGGDSGHVVAAILSVFPLDHFVPNPAERMMVDDEPETIPNVQCEVQAAINKAEGKELNMAFIPRRQFYERAKKAYCVIITGETRGWGCFIFKKGLDVTPDLPNNKRSAHISKYKTL
jgi:L-fucose mutarotase